MFILCCWMRKQRFSSPFGRAGGARMDEMGWIVGEAVERARVKANI